MGVGGVSGGDSNEGGVGARRSGGGVVMTSDHRMGAKESRVTSFRAQSKKVLKKSAIYIKHKQRVI